MQLANITRANFFCNPDQSQASYCPRLAVPSYKVPHPHLSNLKITYDNIAGQGHVREETWVCSDNERRLSYLNSVGKNCMFVNCHNVNAGLK